MTIQAEKDQRNSLKLNGEIKNQISESFFVLMIVKFGIGSGTAAHKAVPKESIIEEPPEDYIRTIFHYAIWKKDLLPVQY